MMLAQHSISILAWEVSLSFGLILVQRAKMPIPPLTPASAKWVSLEVHSKHCFASAFKLVATLIWLAW